MVKNKSHLTKTQENCCFFRNNNHGLIISRFISNINQQKA